MTTESRASVEREVLCVFVSFVTNTYGLTTEIEEPLFFSRARKRGQSLHDEMMATK
jgi:hypothetical protein